MRTKKHIFFLLDYIVCLVFPSPLLLLALLYLVSQRPNDAENYFTLHPVYETEHKNIFHFCLNKVQAGSGGL